MYVAEKIEVEKNVERYIVSLESEIPEFKYKSELNKMLKTFRNKNRNYAYAGKEYVLMVVRFANYLVSEKGMNPEESYLAISFEDAQDFLIAYCLAPNKYGDLKTVEALKRCRRHLTEFLINLKDNGNISLQNHYLKRVESMTGAGRRMVDYELALFLNNSQPSKKVFRECPQFFVEELLEQARRFNPDMWMLICLQVAAGLRPSEACNVRCEDSCYGPGILRQYDSAGGVRRIQIDIKKDVWERPLRNDGIFVGSIKKPRMVEVHPSNVEFLSECLDVYISLTADRNREKYGPLVTNYRKRNGYNMAMTYDSYRKAFKQLVEKWVIPALLAKGGIEAAFAKEMQGEYYGPHMLREGFTCQLVRKKEDWYAIMNYRGDRSPESAVTYVMKGGVVKDAIDDIKEEIGMEIQEYGKQRKNDNLSGPYQL